MRILPLFVLALAPSLFAADPPSVDTRELPRFPAVAPQDALATFQIKPGFHLELVAAEPLVTSPITVSFDENGRMFVLEMRDYSEQREEKPHLGRVRLLEDRDDDGRFEQASIFAENLPWPTALMWANGGVFVCASPDIWWLQDTDGDGRADVREIVFTGFNTGNPKLNVQALPNCLSWGPDNRIHLQSSSGNRGLIRCLKRPDLAPQELAARDFWFDPRTWDFGFEAGGGQYGMSYDDRGRRYVCNNSDHLRTYLFDTRYAARNPFCPLPSPLASVAADGPAAEVFRISPDEPWRVVRTRWRASGRVPGVVEGGGRVSGYFTGATGTTVYRGDAFGAEFIGNTFTGDAGGGIVHRKQIRADGVSVIGERPADERNVEFLASRDTWFRPVHFANAPDGTLYVIDMYREVIEHPWSIPEPIKQHLDLTSGRDHGRIWRITPAGFKPRPGPNLAAAKLDELVATLAHPNGWHRDTANRLIWERRDAAVPPLLGKFFGESKSPLGRLHALRALDDLAALNDAILLAGLDDADDAVRELAVLLCEKQANAKRLPDSLWTKLSARIGDPAPRVRLQLAFTIADLQNEGALRALASLARDNAKDRWISAAILTTPPERMAALFRELLGDPVFAKSTAGELFLAQLATGIGARHDPAEISAALESLAESSQLGLLTALGDGLARASLRLAKFDRNSRLPALFATSRVKLGHANESANGRIAAARFLGLDTSTETRGALLDLLANTNPPALLRAAFAALESWPAEATAAAIVDRWMGFDSTLRAEAVRFLAAKPNRSRVLLTAVESGAISRDAVPETTVGPLRQSRDASLATLAAKLFPAPVIESRDDVIRRLTPALELTGDPAAGRTIFQQRCTICHRLRGEGSAFGPDLESVVTGGKEKLLTHILDPNRELAPQFAAYTIDLTDGTTLAGVLAGETPEALTLREPLGRESTIARSRVARAQTTGKSAMPEGLEAGLSASEVASLLEFLTKGTKP